MNVLRLLSALLVAALLVLAGATGARWYDTNARKAAADPLAGAAAGATTAAAPPPVAPDPAKPVPVKSIELEALQKLLALLDKPSRDFLLASDEKFSQFVQQEAKNQSVLAAAYANDVERNEPVRLLMQRASQKALVEAYMADIVRRNLDPKFPSDAQIQEFYDKNPEAFRIPDRVHLWQVFIPADESATKSEQAAAKALATQVAEALRKGKSDIAAQALKYSRHNESRLNGGYMGLLRRDELLPPVREAVQKADAGDIVGPVRTPAGFHVLKRGETVPGTSLGLEEARPRVVAQLKREAALKIRQAAVDKVAQTYPVSVDATALASWRKSLAQADFGQVVPAAGDAAAPDPKAAAKPAGEASAN
ncbi:MAG: peptidyl-prolyl cis-trans isomerase [Gammaproteobacteria bacterium]|nr:peptidyl-prolyl cis-trans isomerase [Gammaproteobacteria bacterium]MBI5617638.1 peptidyl-prolyl cis-trans isomerase [Gammaproteobacteria bacterium]